MNNKSLSSIFLAVILVCGLILVGAIRFGTAQSSTSSEPLFNISGYILDPTGNGIGGANIVFNVPQIVPSVYSDPSGHYEISAPAGTYHVNVWPPFDSNYVNYDEPSFVVGSDMTKNITLYSGCKVSGYISDSSGTPVTGAVVLLRNSVNTFGSGWFSNYLGYYFLSVPAGTYTIDAHPRTGYSYSGTTTDFPTYYEYNFIVNGNLTKNITVGSTVSTSNRTKISGYVLDANGNALAGAEIIFSVPDIVPNVYTNDLGYYEIYAPADIYHLAVWPPFDSNYLSYDQPTFSVGSSDMIKNITLSSGYKLSGYLTGSTGAPIRGALVSLDLIHCGWYSNSAGYYFVTAPAGTYKLMIQPKTGPTFSTYTENNFVLTCDTVRNFTLTTSGNTPVPTPNPEPNSTLPSEPQVSVDGAVNTDDFSADSGAWQYLGSAYRDQTNQSLVLTTSSNDQTGVAFFKTPIQDAFTASFNYKGIGDGFLFFFYKQTYPSTIDWEESYGDNGVAGGRLGFNTQTIIPGYGIEFDSWANVASEFADIVGGKPNPSADPSDSHIALIKDFTGNHLAYVNDQRIYDNAWHQVSIEVQGSSVAVYLDQELVLQWNGVFDRTYGGLGFSGSNGHVAASWHLVDNFSITARNLQKPSLTVSCRSSTSYSGFNVQIDGYLTLNETGISDAPILLSYSVTGGKSWEDLTLVYTGSDGSYSATWLPSVTGNYLIKATYEGDADTLGTSSEIVNFAVTNFAEKNLLFSVSSNSTVTSLAFNSTTSELSFTVSGPSETTGYVKVAIAKSLVSNAENIKVYLDGNQLNYEVTSNEDAWLLTFTYKHSTHQVMISLAANAGGAAFLSIEPWVWIASTIVIGTLFTVRTAFMHRRRVFQHTGLTAQNQK